jgi:hypothetical protein
VFVTCVCHILVASHFSLLMWLFILQMRSSSEDDVIDDGLQLSTLIEEETRDVITDLLNWAKMR